MSECFICSTNNCICKEKKEIKLGEKSGKSLVKPAETRKGNLLTAALSTVKSVWISDAYYKCYVHPKNVEKP